MRRTTHRPPRWERKRLDPLIPLFQDRSFIPPETPLPRRTRSQKDPLGRSNLVRPFGHETLDLFLEGFLTVSSKHGSGGDGF